MRSELEPRLEERGDEKARTALAGKGRDGGEKQREGGFR